MKILIFSVGEKGFHVVNALNSLGTQVSLTCVIGQDKNLLDDYSMELKRYCQANEIDFFFRDELNIPIDEHNLYIAVGWRWLIHNITKEKLIVFHDSLLPRYRGFAPLVNALLNKESNTGVTALLGADEYDKGNIILQHRIDLIYPTSIQNEIKRISKIYANMAIDLVTKLGNESITLEGSPQDESKASYSLWRDDQDYRINWNDSAKDISHFISCVGSPFLGASTMLKGAIVRILKASPIADVKIENRIPGKVIFKKNGLPIVVCGSGLLLIEDIRNNENKTILPLEKFRSRFI